MNAPAAKDRRTVPRNRPAYRPWAIPSGYRLLRGLIRLMVLLFFPRVRLLGEEQPQFSGPVVLAVNYPESFCAALLVVATVKPPVLCLLPSPKFGGPLQQFLGGRLGIVPTDPLGQNQEQWVGWLASALANWQTVAVFTESSRPAAERGKQECRAISDLVFETLDRSGEQLRPAVHPVCAFLPPDKWRSGILVYVDAPIATAPSSPPAETEPEPVPPRTLSALMAARKNVFSLEPVEIERFHADLESVAQEDLKEEWFQIPEWKQQPEELQLSGFVKQWMREQNQVNPGRVVALRKSLESYREARRRGSLGRLRVETSNLWESSPWRLAAAWGESIFGLPVAAYGLINHLPAGFFLLLTGLLRHRGKRDAKVEWMWRGFIVMGCYIAQTWLVDWWLGRAAAGYYALSLPVTGLYLWRYRWLARNRSQLLLLRATLRARSARLRRTRKSLLDRLEDEMTRYAASLGMPS